MMAPLAKLQALLKQIGSYQCNHLEVNKTSDPRLKKSCCSDPGEQFIPICGLTDQPCVGLPQCPRLDVQTKSELNKAWNEDIRKNKPINLLKIMKKK